ncbi:MAG: hypothetical protein DRG30_01110 [Epsilonproteobacteria bacterium]|nr:MAG: hypothetical protein DRG30_01110 [Campylobacterota bacterium]
MKLLFAKITIFIAFLSLAITVFYFSQKYPIGQAFPLGTLLTLAITASVAIFLYILSFLLIPIASVSKKTDIDDPLIQRKHAKKPFAILREEITVQHNIKEEYTQLNHAEQIDIHKTQQKLAEMMQEQGTAAEILLILPSDLSFLLAKGSIENLFWGKIREENEEAGVIVGSAGFGSLSQEIRLSIQSITQHSSKMNIISKSSKKQQSDIKNSIYIKKINDFLRDKEKFYTE